MAPERRTLHAPYPAISDYGFIGDGSAGALVSRAGSIDWCCMPRIDDASVFGRLLDWDHGGHYAIQPSDSHFETMQRYIDDTMVLETTFECPTGEARLVDLFAVPTETTTPHRQLLRIIEGTRGHVPFTVTLEPRFDYGTVRPWLRLHAPGVWSAVGGNDAVIVSTDLDLDISDTHNLRGTGTIRTGDRARIAMTTYAPWELDPAPPDQPTNADIDRRLEETIAWWQAWAGTALLAGPNAAEARRSGLVLKALINSTTGALAAAPTTSLPEAIGADRNWDYRYSWIRDSQFAVRSLAELGCADEADAFRRFIERSAAGSADGLQIMYGLGGERRLNEQTLPLEGYRRSKPVRIGNAASGQLQLDVYGELLDLAWRWHQRGHSPDDDYWRFLVSLVEAAAASWDDPDHGLWEVRGEPRHFVHSKAMCWVALDRGMRLAEECLRQAPIDRWRKVRDRIHRSIHRHGIDRERNTFVQAYDGKDLDAALLLLPTVDFIDYNDPLMTGTVAAIISDLDEDGLLRRYQTQDGLDGREGLFIACTFWLAECLAYQGDLLGAQAAYDRGTRTANVLGLFAEEFDPHAVEPLGNYPQALTHLSHIAAAVALQRNQHQGIRRP